MSRKTRRRVTFETLLASAGIEGSPLTYAEKTMVFRQGDTSDSVFYIQKGHVQLTVLSRQGREAVIAVLNSGVFFGEACLAREQFRTESARTLTHAIIVRIAKPDMMAALRKSPVLSERFVQHLLSRNIRIQEDLVDHLFNSSEKRLARVLLLLAQFGKNGTSQLILPRLSQETLAKMIGTTRGRVNFFMNKFRERGFIEYNGELRVHSSLLDVVVHD